MNESQPWTPAENFRQIEHQRSSRRTSSSSLFFGKWLAISGGSTTCLQARENGAQAWPSEWEWPTLYQGPFSVARDRDTINNSCSAFSTARQRRRPRLYS
jgi:hypothetical protein